VAATSNKPVRECAGCGLDLGKRCAFFEYPVDQWKHRSCEGYNSPELIERFSRMQHPDGAHKRKELRIEKAKMAHTVDHQDGAKRPGATP
jgi:hypothetical protein